MNDEFFDVVGSEADPSDVLLTVPLPDKHLTIHDDLSLTVQVFENGQLKSTTDYSSFQEYHEEWKKKIERICRTEVSK